MSNTNYTGEYQEFLRQRQVTDSESSRNEFCDLIQTQESMWGEK